MFQTQGPETIQTILLPELRAARNHLSALRKKLKNLKLINPNHDLVSRLQTKHNRLSAQYKKLILQTKRVAWQRFCTEQTKTFGTAQKIF